MDCADGTHHHMCTVLIHGGETYQGRLPVGILGFSCEMATWGERTL